MNFAMLALALTLPLAAQADALGPDWEAGLIAAEAACPQNILDLTAQSPQQIGILVLSPCHAGESVVVDHAGLVVQSQLGANGALYIALPTGAPDAAVTVTYRDGSMQDAVLAPPDAADIQEAAARF